MRARPCLAVLGQSLLVAACLIVLAVWPPRQGALLLVPLGGPTVVVLNAALGTGATVIGRGPVAGSIVVDGDRRAVAAAVAGQRVLVLAAPSAVCGGRVAGRA